MPQLKKTFGNDVDVHVRGFREGSVIVDYDVFVPSNKDLTAVAIKAGISKTITEAIADDSGYFAKHGADPLSIKIDGM